MCLFTTYMALAQLIKANLNGLRIALNATNVLNKNTEILLKQNFQNEVIKSIDVVA